MMPYVRDAYTKSVQQRHSLAERILDLSHESDISEINTELLMLGLYLLFV